MRAGDKKVRGSGWFPAATDPRYHSRGLKPQHLPSCRCRSSWGRSKDEVFPWVSQLRGPFHPKATNCLSPSNLCFPCAGGAPPVTLPALL